MNEISTLNANGARASVTGASRTDAASSASQPAMDGKDGGKSLPPISGSTGSSSVKEQVAVQEQDVQRAVTKINDYVQSVQRDLRFSVDEELGQPIVQVIDSSTRKVIRQIPNEVVIRLARNLNALQEQALAEQFGGKAAGPEAKRLGLINTRI
jgi:flagellar protein FlaG